ncbi:hypothetical protein [Parvularcula sp. LCG005]|uniref:hypothetical protein n=1 Tax=Parvularcula sp. LCG005 TaxID=3078805 RepID=UPI002943411D|nr:hypothetical protein [Parvularcula sp. LCG005]WOI54778.1 hypothetical protein RUI03_07180 [Parvularcula sp. LCG005]
MRVLLALAVFVTLSLKMVSAVHATSYGDGPHDHDGVPCVMAHWGSHQDDDWLVTDDAVLIEPVVFAQISEFLARSLIVPTVRILPPGRAPPHA